jgi:TonB-linked SusC/RagA family outer membrane protein
MQKTGIFCIGSSMQSAADHPCIRLIMRTGILLFTIVLLTAQVLQAAPGFGQGNELKRISLDFSNTPIQEVFAAIEHRADVVIMFENTGALKNRKVSISVKDRKVAEVLDLLLRDKSLVWNIRENVIRVQKAGKQLEAGQQLLASAEQLVSILQAAAGPVTGVICGQDGKPLRDATVKVKGGNASATTDDDGVFSIAARPGDLLAISYIGYEPQLVSVTGEKLNILLKISVSPLDDVQIIAYGTTSRRISTGNVSTVSSKEIEQQPVSNPLQALSGRIPGVLITETSGAPGGGIAVQVRGVGSLLSGTNPLYIVDGVPYLSEAIYSAGGNTNGYLKPAYGSSPLNAINPADIESISVLKDADATAIYGSRGSNGVVLITTKKGKAGKTRVDVNLSHGITGIADIHRVKPLNLSQYLEIRRAAYANSNATPTTALAPDLLVWDTTHKQTTDFQKLLIGNTANVTDASIGFSGGNQQTNFLLSGTWHRETNVLPGDNYYQRGAVHFSIEHTSLDRKFTASISNSLVWDKTSNIGRVFQSSDMAGYMFTIAPNFPLYDAAGNLYWYSNSFSFENPMKYKYQTYTAKNNNMVGAVNLKYAPVTGLNIRLNSSYNKIMANAQNYVYSKGINPFSTTLPSAFFQENLSEVWNIEPQADYTTNVGKGKINVLGGATFQGTTYNQPYYLVGTNYSSDALLTNPQAAGTRTLYTFYSDYKYQSFFGRANYNWQNKYIVNVNYRWDASSRFGINNRYGSFASVGGAWVFSDEKYMKQHLRAISYGKLRASYGSTGNDQISDYQYMDTYSTYAYGYNNVSSIVPSRIANPNLKWEVNKKLEIAMDLGFFQDRILVSGAWFRNITSNPLVSAPLTAVTGFGSYTANLPATIEQKGTEFTLTTKNIQRRNFSWTTNFNITFADSKLTSFDNFENTSYYNTRVLGRSMSALYGFKYTGIDKTTQLPGFVDANKSGANLYTEVYPAENGGAGDYVYLGKTNPDYYGGMNNSFSYKGFQLDVFIQFVGHVMKKGSMATASTPGYNVVNMYDGVYDLFKETNGKIATRTFSYTEGSAYLSFVKYLQSDAVLSNAAYARLKNISLSYTLNGKWLSKFKIAAAQVYVRGQNLFTVSGYKGFDPETGSSFMPPLRTITAGAKFSF